jgi:dolichol-phosphate mannosyltransferase
MLLTIVSPVFNEEHGIGEFLRELDKVALVLLNRNVTMEVILVNDGSTDKTLEKISEFHGLFKLKTLHLSRNFGHQSAVWAGIEKAKAESWIIVMDSDLQDPPIQIIPILEVFLNGTDVVFMKRRSRQDGFWKVFFAKRYYAFQALLTGNLTYSNIGDFYGLSPRAKSSLLLHTEKVKYIRGIVAQLGFNQTILEYDREKRVAGKTHYTIAKMFSLAVAGVTGFSIRPLFWVGYAALIGAAIAVVSAAYVLVLKIVDGPSLQPGWAFLSLSLLLLSALQLMGLASIALYVGRIVQEVKNRPIYIEQEFRNEGNGDS